MNTKNYLFRENATDLQYFCQLQVSNKFRRTMTPQEAELIGEIADRYVHRTATEEEVLIVKLAIEQLVAALNAGHEGNGPFLVVTFSELRRKESGFIRIERTSGRHQSVLLPIIDCKGSVKI